MATAATPMPPNEAVPSPDSEGASRPLSIPAPVKKFFAQTGKHVSRQVNRLGSQANQVVGSIMGKDEKFSTVSRGQNQMEMSAEGSSQPQMSPEVKKYLRVSLRVGAGILAAVVTLKVGGAITGSGKKGERKTKKPETPVKPGVRMKEDMDKKARAAADSVVRATSEVKGAALRAVDEVKATADKTKEACDRTRDACLKATADSMEVAAEAKAIYDAALEGAKKQIRDTNERKRKEAEKWIEKQPKKKEKSKQVVKEEPPKELSGPLKSLEFVKYLLTEKVERVYFHMFP